MGRGEGALPRYGLRGLGIHHDCSPPSPQARDQARPRPCPWRVRAARGLAHRCCLFHGWEATGAHGCAAWVHGPPSWATCMGKHGCMGSLHGRECMGSLRWWGRVTREARCPPLLFQIHVSMPPHPYPRPSCYPPRRMRPRTPRAPGTTTGRPRRLRLPPHSPSACLNLNRGRPTPLGLGNTTGG